MKLLEFLSLLATDSDFLSNFRASPQAALTFAGLSADDQRLLLNGDPLALRRAVYAEQIAGAQSPTGNLQAEQRPEFIQPPTPDEKPEFIPPPSPGPHQPELSSNQHPPPPKPPGPTQPELSSNQHPPPPKQASGGPEATHYEPLDFELNLAQDAVLAGVGSGPGENQDLGGARTGKGLTVVGTGIRAGLHMTVETQEAIKRATTMLYLVADPVTEACIRKLNPAAQSMGHLYAVGKQRIEIYETIIGKILGELDASGDVCVAFYGHAGVLCYPAWESIRRARATGRQARMLPAISTEDTLFADLGLDMGNGGLQSFEATRFMYYKYNFDPCAGLLLWQLSVLGEDEWNPPHTGVRPRLDILVEYLKKSYPPEHEVFLYHAPEFPTSRPMIERVALADLPRAELVSISTMYIPPRGQPERNEECLQALERLEVRRA